MKRQGCRLYPLGDCNPACRIPFRSASGMGLPSKLGDALLSAIARDNVFSISYAIQQSILVNPAFQLFYSESTADMRSGHSNCETALGCKLVLMNVAHR